jgi:hypothetical protein
VIQVQVSQSADDGFYTRDLSEFSTVLNSNYFGRSGSFERRQYDRWVDVALPQGAVIDSAWLTGRTLNMAQTSDPAVVVRGHAIDSAGQIADSAGWSAAWSNGTTASDSVYSWDDWPLAFTWYRLPFNVTAVIQELVDRPGWKPGNAVVLLFQGYSSAERSTSAFDNGAGDSLTVYYSVASGPTGYRRRVLIAGGS